MKHMLLAGAMALALVSTPARADFLDDLFGGSSAWMARAHGNLASIAARYSGRGNFTGARVPWCALFVSKVIENKTGRNPHIMRAIDFAHFGKPSVLAPGAIIVKRHHVYIHTGGSCGIGGNEKNRVLHRCGRSMRGVIAIRSIE